MKIAGSYENQLSVVGISDPVTAAMEKYCYHPSVHLIEGPYRNAEAYCLKRVPISEIIEHVDIKKASPIDSIPAKVIKDNVDIVASYLLDHCSKSVDRNFFPDEMEDGDFSALFKKQQFISQKEL